MSEPAKCCFCKSETRYFTTVQNNRKIYHVDCPVCRLYFISDTLWNLLKDRIIDSALLWCISENVKFNASKDPTTTSWHSKSETIAEEESDVVIRFFESFLDLRIDHAAKTTELLVALSNKVPDHDPFGAFRITDQDFFSAKINGSNEAAIWVDHLVAAGLLDASQAYKAYRKTLGAHLVGPIGYEFAMTVNGWAAVNRLNVKASNHGFIAMSFSYAERNRLEAAILDGCKSAGFDAVVVDRHEYVGGVVDEIMAKINSAKFVVADLTEHKHGVYFEAGYAMARGIPVVFTVDAKDTKQIHFDVKHLNQIRWLDYDDLSRRLSNRLRALFH